MEFISKNKYTLFLLICAFILGFLISKNNYKPYWEVSGDIIANDYYSVIIFLNEDFEEHVKNIKNDEVANRSEWLEYVHDTESNGRKLRNLLLDYNSHDIGRKTIDFIYFIRRESSIKFDSKNNKVLMEKEDKEYLDLYLEKLEGIKGIINDNYPSLAKGDHEKEEVIEGGRNVWKDGKWKEVIEEINNYLEISNFRERKIEIKSK